MSVYKIGFNYPLVTKGALLYLPIRQVMCTLILFRELRVTMNVYTHIGFDDAEKELKRMEEFRKAQAEIEKKNDAKAVSQKMFKAI